MNTFRPLSIAILGLLGHGDRAWAQGFLVHDLGPGIARDINGSGKVVGSDGTFGFYFDGTSKSLVTHLLMPTTVPVPGPPTPVAAVTSDLVGINDAGERVGAISTVVGSNASVKIVGTNMVIFGDLITPPTVSAINTSGVVAGWQSVPPQGFNNGLEVGGTLGAPNFSRFHAINASGTFAGSWGAASPAFRDFRVYRSRAMVFSASGQMTVLDDRTLPDEYISFAENAVEENHWSDAYGINAAGVVVGAMRATTAGPRTAFRHAGAGMEPLGTLGGARSVAFDINTAGVVVGESETAPGVVHAFRYANGTMVDLNTLLPQGSGWELLTARAINDRGEVVGQGRYQGALHAYVLSPSDLTPPPWIVSGPLGGRLAVGQSLTLRVEAGGVGPLAYQWSRNGTNLLGATSAAYVIASATGRDVGDYRVEVRNVGGTVTSGLARVDVLDPELAVETFVGLRIAGEVGATYEIQYRDSANAGEWIPLTRITLTTSPTPWLDPDSNRNTGRLYRAVRQP